MTSALQTNSSKKHLHTDVAYDVLFMFSAEKKIQAPRDKKKRPAILHYSNANQTELFWLTLVLDQTLVLTSV